MKDLIKKNLSGKKVLVFFILSSTIYLIMLLITIPYVMSFSGGMKLLDLIPTGYNAEYVHSLFNSLGEKGRNAYLFKQIPLDMIYPSLFGISYCLILAYFLNKIGKLESILFYVCFFPVFSGLFDYCENIGIIIMLNTYPDYLNKLAQITNIFSILKSSFTTITFIILITILIVFGFRKIFMRAKIV